MKGGQLKVAGLVCVAFFICWMVYDNARNSTRHWFKDTLPDPHTIETWSSHDLDARLFKLSRWEQFNPAQFRRFVTHQIDGLDMSRKDAFHFLEVGVGVGAFAREILRQFPNATGVGFDLEAEAVAIAERVLPRARMTVYTEDMVHFRGAPDTFDLVLVPGSLCYLHSMDDVLRSLAEMSRVLKPGGGLCASMLASRTSAMGSCNIRIPKRIWHTRPGLTLVRMQEMDGWGLPHSYGRYAVCLRKTK